MASENFSYTKTGQTVRIDKVEQPGTVVVIPERMEDCLVTELGAYVLAGSNVEELHLPVQLKKIGAYGFYNCEKLKRLYCGSRAADLGAGLFAGTGGKILSERTAFRTAADFACADSSVKRGEYRRRTCDGGTPDLSGIF